MSTSRENSAHPVTSIRGNALTEAYSAYRAALAGRNALVCFAVKANSNLAVLNLFARLGAWHDIVAVREREEAAQLYAGESTLP